MLKCPPHGVLISASAALAIGILLTCLSTPGTHAQSAAATCDRTRVGEDYLSGVPKEQKETATRLARQIKTFTDNFERIFPRGKQDATAGMNLEMRERLLAVADNLVTHDTAKKALEDAAHQLEKLSFSYGVEERAACRVCYQINDWLFLRNLAQASGGQLVFFDDRGTDADGNYTKAMLRTRVDTITFAKLSEVTPFIKIYRAAAKSLELYFGYLDRKGSAPEALGDEQIKLRIAELVLAKDAAMKDIISTLNSIASDATDQRPIAQALRSYRCEHFDGSAVD